jgi:hypothetical protein
VVPETDHRIAHDLEQKPQALEVLTHNIDTSTPEGRLFLGPFAQRYVMRHSCDGLQPTSGGLPKAQMNITG